MLLMVEMMRRLVKDGFVMTKKTINYCVIIFGLNTTNIIFIIVPAIVSQYKTVVSQHKTIVP
jgi:hypothetical protein